MRRVLKPNQMIYAYRKRLTSNRREGVGKGCNEKSTTKQKNATYNEPFKHVQSVCSVSYAHLSTPIMRPAFRPLGRYQIVSIVSCALLFTAFLFLLLVALSLPIIKTIYLVKLTSEAVEASPLSIATQLRFGVWGVCAVG